MALSSLPTLTTLPTLTSSLDTMVLLAVTESPEGRKGTALAVEMDALTFFPFWEVSSVKE